MTARAAACVPASYRSRIDEGPEPEILGRIENAAIDLVLWRRELPFALAHWLDTRKPHQLPSGRILVGLDDLVAGVAAMVPGKSRPARLLAADIIDLARRYAGFTGMDLVDIRLDVIRHDACWRFHRDMVPLRLITTYRGRGTQIPPFEEAERALAEQRSYCGPLEELSCGTVALFRGDPNDSGQGMLHRSPPVAGTDITRLLLCLNQPSAVSPHRWTP